MNEKAPITFYCPDDGAEMIYHIATDQWQCPKCHGVAVTQHTQDGGKPQTEDTDEPSDDLQRGTG